MFLVATNVVASPPPERPPTGMLNSCAKRKREHIKPRDEGKIENQLKMEEKEEKGTPKVVKKPNIKKDKLVLNWASSPQTRNRIWCKIEPH